MTIDQMCRGRQLSRSSGLIVLSFVGLAVMPYLVLLPRIEADLAEVETSLLAFFVSTATHPAAEGVYLESLINHLKPWTAIRVFWLSNPLVFLLPLAVLGRYWAIAVRFEHRFKRLLWPAGLPAIFGLALFPFSLRGLASSYMELNELGLANPGTVAHGLGEASATPMLGILISALCLFLMAWNQPRWSELAET